MSRDRACIARLILFKYRCYPAKIRGREVLLAYAVAASAHDAVGCLAVSFGNLRVFLLKLFLPFVIPDVFIIDSEIIRDGYLLPAQACTFIAILARNYEFRVKIVDW